MDCHREAGIPGAGEWAEPRCVLEPHVFWAPSPVSEQAIFAFAQRRIRLPVKRTLSRDIVEPAMGPDAPWPPGNWPGESMRRELELHVEAGIPPLDVIRIAAYNSARYLR